MKTLQKTLMIAALLLAGASSAHAQYDTTAWPDPWYLYQPKPDCPLSDPVELIKLEYAGENYKLYHDYLTYNHAPFCFTNPVYHATEDITIYGIAVTMDTMYKPDYILDPFTSDTINVVYDTCLDEKYDVRFNVELLRPKKPGKVYVADSVKLYNCDEKPVHGRRHHTKFRYDCDTLVDDMVANCWELYFREPHHIAEGDSFYVGYVGRFAVGRQFFSRYIIEAEKDNPDLEYAYQGSFIRHYPNSDHIDFGGHFFKYWGFIFPIVGLRCTEPKGLRLERQSGDTALFSWTMYNLAESYEVLW